jgi:hypothetical protein
MERERRMKERSTSGGWEGGSYGDLKSGDCQALATMPEGAGRLTGGGFPGNDFTSTM